jgi:hypothetical protein
MYAVQTEVKKNYENQGWEKKQDHVTVAFQSKKSHVVSPALSA